MAAHEDGALRMAAAGPPILSVRGLSKSFAATPVLTDVNLEVARGAIVALLGASGSGKTTLLQAIAGLVAPDAGTIVIDGQDVRDVPAHGRPVNMMFQSYALFPHLTVAGNVAYGLKARGTPREERERLVAWALELVRLEGLGSRRPDQLSGGQRQRVALARCLVMKPAVLLLDEPMAALDRRLRADVQKELKSIQRKVGATFVLVTHDQDEAMAMSDYIAVMDKGRIVQFGPPREVYERPTSMFVASFLGTINLFAGSTRESAGPQTRLVTDDGLEVVSERSVGDTAGPVIAIGVRPEKIVVAREPTGLANDFAGTVEQVSYGGTSSDVTIRLTGGRAIEATAANSAASVVASIQAGERVHVGFPGTAGIALPA